MATFGQARHRKGTAQFLFIKYQVHEDNCKYKLQLDIYTLLEIYLYPFNMMINKIAFFTVNLISCYKTVLSYYYELLFTELKINYKEKRFFLPNKP